MDYSVREAKANFAHATAMAASGERVIITKHGKPFVEIIAARSTGGVDFAKLDDVRSELGLKDHDASWFDEFISNPEASRRVLGLED